MTSVVIFPSVLGVRAGIEDAALRLRGQGHEVLVSDWLEGRGFDDYDPAIENADAIPQEELFRRADSAVDDLPERTVVLGFSMGCVLATHVALTRPVSAVVSVAGAIPPSMLGGGWPDGVPLQIHQTVGDFFRDEGFEVTTASEVEAAGGRAEVFDYPGTGHLFTDPSRPDEYDAAATELFWERVLPFVEAAG